MFGIKAKIRRDEKGAVLEIPIKIASEIGEEAEIFPLRDGFYLLCTTVLGQKSLGGREMEVIEKLSRLKFEKRSPKRVEGILDDGEKKILEELIKRRMVWIYNKGKYAGEGVYNISNEVYKKVSVPRETGAKEEAQKPGAQEVKEGIFGSKEYLVLDEKDEGKIARQDVMEQLKKGEIFAAKGPERKIYLCTNKFYSGNLGEFSKSLEKGKGTAEMAVKLGMDEDAALVMLKIMCEQGEAIEKRKGIYATV